MQSTSYRNNTSQPLTALFGGIKKYPLTFKLQMLLKILLTDNFHYLAPTGHTKQVSEVAANFVISKQNVRFYNEQVYNQILELLESKGDPSWRSLVLRLRLQQTSKWHFAPEMSDTCKSLIEYIANAQSRFDDLFRIVFFVRVAEEHKIELTQEQVQQLHEELVKLIKTEAILPQ